MSRLLKALAVGALCVSTLVVGGAAVAGASPVKAPAASSGTFTCTTGSSGSYTLNSGHSTVTPWTGAHLNFTGGMTGVFVPSSITTTTTVTAPTGAIFTTSSMRIKGNGHAPATYTCTISASGTFTTEGTSYPYSLTGTVTGMIVMNS